MYNEHFELKLVRSENDEIEDIVIVSKDGPAIRHDQLADMFNTFLTACGYVGHDYQDANE